MKKDPKILLGDMLYSIERINKMTLNMSFDDFSKDLTKQDAVIRRLAVIGEAANSLPKDFTERHKGVEWRGVIGMRNFLVHEYFEIDMEVVWNTIEKDIPKLKAEISKILKEA
ncbi:MAG: DUF86 domain-containing protein [Candidatus Marsarchaeota archaeon]|nr:DUF86 domain-containing protein [Candidatus Marsarchaeota archaeon]